MPRCPNCHCTGCRADRQYIGTDCACPPSVDDDFDPDKDSTPTQRLPMRNTDKTGLPARRRACGNCGRLGHLNRTCRAPRKAHDKIGVEVAGWWFDLAATKRTADNWHMDGTEDGSLTYGEGVSAYEFRTRPGSLGEAISQVIAIYPDKCDPSAGMHVHMSFHDPADVSTLACPEFLRYYRERWEAWGRRMNVHSSSDFWSRLRGDNDDYCAINDPSEHLTTQQLRRGSRYRQLNWTAWRDGARETLENRMLPLFRDARLAVSALEEWVAIVEDFLRDHADAVLAKFDRAESLDVASLPPVENRELDVMACDPSAENDLFLTRTDEIELDVITTTQRAPRNLRGENTCVHCGKTRNEHFSGYCDRRTPGVDRNYWAAQRELTLPMRSVRTVALDLPESVLTETAAEFPVTPATPVPDGHVRVFGRTGFDLLTRRMRAEIGP